MSSGILSLDRLLGGGLPKGRIIEVYGEPGTGKTTVALHAMAEVQRSGGLAVFLDVEHALDPVLAEGIGVDVKSMRKYNLIHQPDYAEQALGIIETYLDHGFVDLIVLDSVAALIPKKQWEADIDSSQGYSELPKIMSLALRKFTQKAAKAKCTIVLINQLRVTNMSGYGNPKDTTGERALKYATSLRLEVKGTTSKADQITRAGDDTWFCLRSFVICCCWFCCYLLLLLLLFCFFSFLCMPKAMVRLVRIDLTPPRLG
ncbi:unnamed protein product [Polarella glacialis]|uniref:Uncharacterized protein n=1 Tax=Polarella glacialis TaxID=89957 RepID=A0A813IIN9_POLGL|nr:unnamed protein product [Polarella glacialis]